MALDTQRLERDLRNGVLQLLILGVIRRSAPIHGYAIIQELERLTGMDGSWKEGTIYPLLAGLDRQGVLRSRWGDNGPGARRKYYELTPQGHRSLSGAAARWQALRDVVTYALEDPWTS